MSGSGRKSQYRKGITTQFDAEEVQLAPGDEVGLVLANRGAHIFTVQLAGGPQIAAKLSNKFHKAIWLKPRDYVVIETQTLSGEATDGVLAIKHILSKENIRALKGDGLWPSGFEVKGDEKGRQDGKRASGGAVVSMQDLIPDFVEQEDQDREEEEEEGGTQNDEHQSPSS